MNRIIRINLLILAVTISFKSERAFSHNSSTAYLHTNKETNFISGTLKLDIIDVNRVIPLDTNGDDQITWGETKLAKDQIATHILRHVYFSQEGKTNCYAQMTDITAEPLNNSYYLVIRWIADCNFRPALSILAHYEFLFDVDRSHVAIASFNSNDPVLFKVNETSRELTSRPPSSWSQFLNFLWQGVWHIFIGYDHILFILTLVMAVFHITSGRLFFELLKVITAFTAAHSITLFLVGTGVISLSSQFVESAIALSIVFGAVNNLHRFQPVNTTVLAFIFGLIHGFGFAGVFSELSPSAESLIVAVLSFNLGVEVGQLAIVACAIPIFSVLKRLGYFEQWAYKLGSVIVSLIALIWFFERITSISVF